MIERSFFGEPRPNPRIANIPRGGTPIDKRCLHCDTPIRAGDQGVLMTETEQPGEGVTLAPLAPLHRDCIEPFLDAEP
jgi:hypothetical protein